MISTIYERDYFTITEEETAKWEQELENEIVNKNDRSNPIRRSRYRDYPKAVRHYLSLFPGHLLDAVDLTLEKDTFLSQLAAFEYLLNDQDIGERAILDFIKSEKAYFIIGSLLKKGYLFGHQALFLFPEFQLGTDYKADYLLVGKNSHGYHFVFVELEAINGNITLVDGEFGSVIRKGLNQVEKWESWLEANFAHLRPIFEKSMGPKNASLAREFTIFDKTRIHFAIVAGRRKNFNDLTQRLQRKKEEERIKIFHYDNLLEDIALAIGSPTY
ncbi:MAG TPA: Shedu anti-phage system protein SduA domain-containing protein [Puia sp.]|jgi:hypothetical protein